jgi:heme oxygenase
LHLRLKRATTAAHVRIERRMPFVAAHFDIPCYRQLLGAFHGFYRPLEAELAATVGDMTDLSWGQRAKLPLLTLDLQALGMTKVGIERLQACERLPAVETPPRALGCLYVLEGSTLGGQVVQRLLLERLGPPVAAALSFFRSYGHEVGARWRSFLSCLESLQDHQAAEEAELAAVDTFSALEGWLQQQWVLR